MSFGFTYNGQHSDNFSLTAEKTTRSLTPPFKARTISIPKHPGEWYQRSDIKERWIKVKISFIQNTVADLWTLARQIAGWLSPMSGPQALTFDNSPGITYYAVLDDVSSGSGTQETDIHQMAILGQGNLLFRLSDPFGHDTQQNLAFANDAAAPTVSGTYETFPIIDIKFTAAVTNPKVTNNSNGAFVLFDHTFANGDTATIDCTTQKIQINGVDAMPDLDLSSDLELIRLQPGANSLSITPTGICTATVYWIPRWL